MQGWLALAISETAQRREDPATDANKNTQGQQAAASFIASLKELMYTIDAHVAKPGKAAEETLAEKGYELMDI